MSAKDEIFDYVMNSPENTNPNVLRSLLDQIETKPFFVELSGSVDEPILTTPFSDILSAVQSGRVVYLKLNRFTGPYGKRFQDSCVGLTRVEFGEPKYSFVRFETSDDDEDHYYNYVFTIGGNNNVSCYDIMYGSSS